mgnify:CR=1 FL=1
MVRIEGLRPRAPRTQALRMLRPHMVPIAAIALAADEACTQLCEALYLDPASRRRYDSKSRGLLTAMVWSEGLREWTNEVNPPQVRLHEPHNWTELIVHGNLHVKVERDTPWRQVSQSERQRLRKQQCQDYTLPFDVVSALNADAAQLPFPIRRPSTPEGWRPNSGSSDAIEGHRVSTVGWLSSDGAYVQLSQSDAPEDVFVPYLGGGSGGDFADISGTGTRQAGGRQWVTYETSEGKRFWITDLGKVRIAVLSRGSDADIETIASSVVAQQPLQLG